MPHYTWLISFYFLLIIFSELLAKLPAPGTPLPAELLAQIPPELLSRLPFGPPAPGLGGQGPLLGGPPFALNGIPSNGSPYSADPKRSAEYEKRQIGIRLLQTGKFSF